MDPKPNDPCPHKKKKGHTEDECIDGMPCDNGGRDWSSAPTSQGCQGPPAVTRG